eukprot:9761336-Lingulodinium_polyedra.AAC.1
MAQHSTPSFGGSSEDPTCSAVPAAGVEEDIVVPTTASEPASSDADAVKRAALFVARRLDGRPQRQRRACVSRWARK